VLTDLRTRVRALLRRRKLDSDLDDELRFHLERQAAKHIRAGRTPDDAMRLAKLDLGGVEQVREQTREAWGARLIESTLQDVSYACRVLRKNPGFTLAVTLSLALGIGANTAIFTLMDAVMWRMLPVKDPDTLLVAARQEDGEIWNAFSYDEFRRLHDHATLTSLAGYATAPINVSLDGPPEPGIRGQLVTGQYFGMLGVAAAIGRTLGPEDDRIPNGHPVVMLSHSYWQRRFAQDRAVIGRTIRLSNLQFTVIGVTPPGFFGVEIGASPDLFLPLMMQPTVMPAFENLLDNPIVFRTWIHTIARVSSGANAANAAAELDTAFQQRPQEREPKDAGPRERIVLTPVSTLSALREQFSQPLIVLLAMVGIVLLTACANTANLLLARAAARRPEFGMRLALGAGRSRLTRQLLVESVVLAGLGGVFGVALARAATQFLVRYISSGRTPITLDLNPNLRILTFTAVVSLLAGVLFGLAPARRATRIDVTSAIRHVRGTVTRGLRPGRLLSIAQVALSLLVLVGATLFVRSLHKLSGDDADRVRQSVLVLKIEPKGSDQRGIPGTTERLDHLYQDLIRSVREIPGVQLASMSNAIPTAPTSSLSNVARGPSGAEVDVSQLMVYPNYFATIGVPILYGRDFGPQDLLPSAPLVCIVNESYVRTLFADVNPVGRPCMSDLRPRRPNADPDARRRSNPYSIVGVVKDARSTNPKGRIPPLIYTTFSQTNTGRGQMVLHVRVSDGPAAVAQRIRQEAALADPMVPMFDIHTLDEEMNAALVQQRLIALLSSLFGGLALLLACIGLYGLLAFTTSQRLRDIGIRLALGAPRATILWQVLRDALVLVALGIAIGIPIALVLARIVSSQISGLLFGLEATDPPTIVATTLALALVAAFAAYWPARRASRVDPIQVLRAD
jgi:predicted permease